MSKIIGIPNLQFVHILDQRTNITKIEEGPQSLCLQTHEVLSMGPVPFIIVPPGHYCTIQNPIVKYEPGKLCALRHGHFVVRFHGEPFPIYPGEVLYNEPNFGSGTKDYSKAIKKLPILRANHGIRLKARLDFDDNGTARCAEDQWQLEGPLTYHPDPNVDIVCYTSPKIITEGDALRVRAMQDTVDCEGNDRVTGEEWLVRKPGAYLPGVFEEVLDTERPTTLTLETALHLQADQNTVDQFGKKRVSGEEWLVTVDDTECFIPAIGVQVKEQINKTVLKSHEYCVVVDPIDKNGKNQLGKRVLRVGIVSFFLNPGESLEKGVQPSLVLGPDEAVVLTANEEFKDVNSKGQMRKPGDRWMIMGPREYIPPIQVSIVARRKAIALGKNEGVYIRDIQTGKVRSLLGPCSYLLTAYEDLWNKQLPPLVEAMLKQGGVYTTGSSDIRKLAYYEQSIDPVYSGARDKSRVVTYKCPGSSAVQVYNYQKKTARVIFGPDLVILGPHENFNVLSLSGGKPKKENAFKSLCLMLGPDFITDELVVETADHARLKVRLAMNNCFEVERGNVESEAKIFSVPDFIGYACRQVGSRIRASVALTAFDEFHRHSAKIISNAVFGVDETGEPRDQLRFPQNNLVVTNIDIQSIEPVDPKMRDSLMQSVQMAIEISTNSIEAAASHEAKRLEQIARGKLERAKLVNEKEAERERSKLCELRAIAAAVESTGQAQAEAQAQAEKMLIECQSEIEGTKLRCEAAEIEHYSKLDSQDKLRSAEVLYQKEQDLLELEKLRKMAAIEIKKMSKMMTAIGKDTVVAMAKAGPEGQVKLLQGLGLESVLLTDGNSPINLFNTAHGLISNK